MNSSTDRCKACNGVRETEDILCTSCSKLVDIIKNKPELYSRLSHLASQNLEKYKEQIEEDEELPDVLDAMRYRTTDRENNTWYISVSELKGKPVEMFASTAFDSDRHLQSRISNLTTITRLLSLILRHIFMGETITLGKTITQLDRSSRQNKDLPALLSGVLSNYRSDNKVEKD